MISEYYRENLNNDIDGKKWQYMITMSMSKSNIFEFTLGSVKYSYEAESKIELAKNFVEKLGFTENLKEISVSNFHYQKLVRPQIIIVRFYLNNELSKFIYSHKTLPDLVKSHDIEIFDPAFYHYKIAYLRTYSAQGYADILLPLTLKMKFINQGFELKPCPK